MDQTYKALAHRAGCIRKRYKLTPLEAAWCALWLAGTAEADIPVLAEKLAELKAKRYQDRKGV